ncbi:hypothetical protein [Candidatus Nitrososphaera sp. FF02]|uniref:hypothetical protein n=1 Tax=Candidatus Nitrososphaera sp. FF02 TaxID=3398226 RepID=UPI0039E81B7F
MEGIGKAAIGAGAAAVLMILIVMYDATVMTALGMIGDNRPIERLEKGGVLSETFTDGDIDGISAVKQEYPRWFFDGSVMVRGGDHDISQVDGEGLYVGVSDPDPGDGTWSGIFAMTPNDYSSVYHVTMQVPDLPVSEDPADYANIGMYIQTDTSTGRINYIACIVDIRPDKLFYRVESGLGNDDSVTSWTVHWEKEMSVLDRTMDCTLLTNGDNHMAAIINGERVFESYAMDLQMPRPFNAYLETQVSGIPEIVEGRFYDYYSAFSSEIRVIKLAQGQIVSLGNVTAIANAKGIAHLDVFHLPQPYKGTLTVHGQSADSTLSGNFVAGDLYLVRAHRQDREDELWQQGRQRRHDRLVIEII